MRNCLWLSAFVVLTLFAATFASGQWTNTPPRDGACFFTDVNYRGESFCMASGQNVSALPSNFNDRIRSIRVYGRAQVQFYNAANFSGVSGSTSRDINDLRTFSVPDDRNKNWSARISSIQIAGSGWGNDRGDRRDDRGRWNRGRDRDRDRDRDEDRDRDGDRDHDNGWRGNSHATVSCSSEARGNRSWCRTPGRVSSVRLLNQGGRRSCEFNRTFGVTDGRLWTSGGCSGTFEVQ